MRYFLILSFFLFLACSNNAAIQKTLTKVESELNTAKEKIAILESQIEPEGKLVHLVFFNTKPDADKAALIAEIKKLESIKEVMDLEVGPFEELGDARALSQYGLFMQMSFANKVAYEIYQKHPIHVALKENMGQFMAGPPATYDFVKK